MNTVHIPESPWTESAPHICTQLQVDPDTGLNPQEIMQRRKKFGLNQLRKAERKSPLLILVSQFESILVLLLGGAAVLSFVFGKLLEGIAITAVIVINAAIGFYTELRAARSMEALYQLTQVTAKVLRDSSPQEVPASHLVPGDIILVDAGDIITADARIVEASKLQVDESALTGESVPVSKSKQVISQASLAERSNMLYKGTAVTRGSAKGVVVTTGEDTELGRISQLVKTEMKEETPLEKRLEHLGQKLVWVTLVVAGVVAVSGIATGKDILLMIETAIALAVATVPEGLPMVATLALARGMWKMARQHALVNQLSAVEALGSCTIICADKTGTLTENQMTVTEVAVSDTRVSVSGTGLDDTGSFSVQGKEVSTKMGTLLKKILKISVLCNNASLEQKSDIVNTVGDPTEIALLVAGKKVGITRDELVKDYPEVKEVSFDPAVNMMATYHENSSYMVAVKGAPEAVLKVCSHVMTPENKKVLTESEKEKLVTLNENMAGRGLRVLAVATKKVDSLDEPPYQELVFVGLLGLLDPPREEVKASITACKQAGISVVMVTGDHAATARTIAAELGILDKDVPIIEGKTLEDGTKHAREDIIHAQCFARVSPEQKLTLVGIYQDQGAIVAMTGDGVNDAPALKKADIGVAMGQRGTQVAKEAADMILQNDDFSTIQNAVEEGRIIFSNIRKFVFYLLSCNISEILVIFLASIMSTPLPVLPLQILFLNVVTDIFPAFALGGGEGPQNIMENPPQNPEEPILTGKHWTSIGVYSAVITISVLSAFFLALYNGMDIERVVTISFLTLAFSQLFHVFNMRDKGSPFIKNEVTINVYVWGAIGLCTVLLLIATYMPGLSHVLKTVDPKSTGWAIIMGMSVVPWGVGQVWNSVVYKLK
ncbi:MAG: cation-transporting P-type ATPase [Candidatus Methanofastidiosia archaeon]|jgi:Ca2+-transporting ATPase